MIFFKDFEQVDIRIGTIISANELKNARKAAFVLEIDFGNIGIKKSSAQITDLYQKETLIGKQILAVLNFPKKQIGNIQSECLVLGSHSSKGVLLLSSKKQVKNGSKVL
jgi:export-related chaperone CsaA